MIWALRRGQRVIKLINILRFKRRAVVTFKLGLCASSFALFWFKPLVLGGSASGEVLPAAGTENEIFSSVGQGVFAPKSIKTCA